MTTGPISTKLGKKSSLGNEYLSLFKWKGHTFLHWEIITKLQKYIHEIIKSSPTELLGEYMKIYNHNFAHLNWFLR